MVTSSGTGNISDIVSIPAGGHVTYTILANFPASATGQVTNTASIIAPDAFTETKPDNNTDPDVDMLQPHADLSVAASADVTTANHGDTINYSLKAHNAGPSDAANTTVVATVPSSLTNVQSISNGGVFDAASNTITWSLGSLAAGADATVTFTASVAQDATGNIDLTANITSIATDDTPKNNSSTATVAPGKMVDLSLGMTDEGSPVFEPFPLGVLPAVVAGTADTFTITLTNMVRSCRSGLSTIRLTPH